MIATLIALSLLSPVGALPRALPTSAGKELLIAASAKPILVVALTSDCPHTKKAIPTLNKLFAKLHGKVTLVGLLHKDPAFVKALGRKLGAQFPLVADEKGTLINLIGASHSLDLSWIEERQASKSTDGMSRAKVQTLFTSSSDRSIQALASDSILIGVANESGCSLD